MGKRRIYMTEEQKIAARKRRQMLYYWRVRGGRVIGDIFGNMGGMVVCGRGIGLIIKVIWDRIGMGLAMGMVNIF